MKCLQELDSALRLYESNFRVLHWNSAGLDFNDSHKSITTELYEMTSDNVDKVAEILCMVGMTPGNYIDILNILRESDTEYRAVESNKLYSRQEICELVDTMLANICKLLSESIEALSSPLDAGIKSELETMLYEYSIQYRYINKRRITFETAQNTTEE